MIHLATGSIFDAQVEALVNPVNCVGTMGKGLAKQFRYRYPEYFADYKRKCVAGVFGMVTVDAYQLNDQTDPAALPHWLVSFPTKYHWRDKSDISRLTISLGFLMRVIHENKIASIAIPALGCGEGGLKWEEVESLIRRAFDTYLPWIEVHLYPPQER